MAPSTPESPRVPQAGVDAGELDPVASVTRRAVPPGASERANRRWWDGEAADYQAEHGTFLGAAEFVWGPEGLTESDAGLLGPVEGKRVLEIGCGAAQCARWLHTRGADVVGIDISWGQLVQSVALDLTTGRTTPVAQADATALPFAAASFDIVCSAYGALPFVADASAVLAEVARVLRPGGFWVFSVTHPIRWAFADDPGPRGLVVRESYFDRTPYVEQDGHGQPTYVEHHRTVGDWVRLIVGAGLDLVDVIEPEWPPDNPHTWGQWSPLRGGLMPGTAIFVTTRRD